MGDRDLYLGASFDGTMRVTLDADHLTTHAVCLGMTGSGKTGLGIVALEELARRGVPLLVVDVKGDMVDLLLNFPRLAADDFLPWLPPDAAAGGDPRRAAEEQAERWRAGLAGAGLGEGDLRAVAEGVRWQLLTPGVAAAAPLDVLPSLAPPPGVDPDRDPDAAAERVNGVAAGLLALIGRGGDPYGDRDQVLVAQVLLAHWRRGDVLDLAGLLGSIADPPFAALGALPVEAYYPRGDRLRLVAELNTLLASPGFGAWTRGMPLTMESILGVEGRPCATIVSIAHLDERQRTFALTLLLSELVAWMRRQPASTGLRALLYIDEVQGILPPHPATPPTKGPLLTLLKQGRAFGVGAWLATQNPVDLDYKALGNAGVKLIGRLITDRDRERALEGLGVGVLPDGRRAEQVVAALGKRQFLMVDVRAKERCVTLASRWAMSYLRGPVALAELGPLLGAAGAGTEAPSGTVPAEAEGAATPPVLASALPVRFAAGAGGRLEPELQVRCRVTLERRSLGLVRQLEELWRIPVTGGGIGWEEARSGDDERDVADEPPAGALFPRSAPAGLDRSPDALERDFVRWRSRQPSLLLANERLELAAEPGEERDAFVERCLEAADRADDTTQERVRARFERRIDTLKRRLERERDELERDREQLEARQAEERIGYVEGLLSVLLGSRSVSSAARKAATRVRGAASKRRMRQSAAGSVEESEREIERLGRELDDLAAEMEEEVERIAAESEATARDIQEILLRPRQADVSVLSFELVWR